MWTVPSDRLGEIASRKPPGCCRDRSSGSDVTSDSIQVMGPLWVGPMHDSSYVARMAAAARVRGWSDAETLLERMHEEAEAESQGALLFYHLGEVQRLLARRGLELPSLASLITALREAGHGAASSHSERKALKTSATLEEVVRLVEQM